MEIERSTNNRPSAGGDFSKSTLEFNSFVRVDMKTLSQSELYSLSRSSSYAFDLQKPENDVIPHIKSDQRSTGLITTTPKRIFAFSHRRGPRHSILGSDLDTQVTEDRLILNSLKTLVSLPVVVDNHDEVQKRNRKRKSKNEKEFEGLGVINVNGEVIDLKFLASAADGAFESELNRMTEGMVGEDELLGFLKGLEGRWGSSRRRRKYVDATVFMKALPVNWKILLSLRPRARRPSLYCRRFVSPSNVHFKSCEDVVFYLKSQFEMYNTNRVEEAAMMQMESGNQMDVESGGQVPRSSHRASKLGFLGTNNLHNVPTCHLTKCTRKRSVPRGLLLVRGTKSKPPISQNSVKQKAVVENKKNNNCPLEDTEMMCNQLKNVLVNGEGASNEQRNDIEGKRNFKTRCIWCLVEFFREPVDAETLESSCGFICPKCKQEVSWRFESALTELTQLANN